MANDDQLFSQASMRDFRFFTDQHGREWGADCEKQTGEPCGPLSPKFRAPMLPPPKYVQITDVRRGRIHINYDLWIHEQRMGHEEYERFALMQANRMFGERGPDEVRKLLTPRQGEMPDPALLHTVGEPPEAVERVLAAQAGNRWVLGLSEKKPSWAEKYFPAPKPKMTPEIARKLFPDAEDEDEQEEPVIMDDIEFPHMYAPSYWWLDAQHMLAQKAGNAKGFRGSGDEAKAEIERLDAEAVGAGNMDPSWEK